MIDPPYKYNVVYKLNGSHGNSPLYLANVILIFSGPIDTRGPVYSNK
jgi:hypothetical protein